MGDADPPVRRTVHQRATDAVTGERYAITRPAIPNANSWQIPSHVMSTITRTTQFHGLEDEDALGHVSRFMRICDTFNITGCLRIQSTCVSSHSPSLGVHPLGLMPSLTIPSPLGRILKPPPSWTARLRDQIHSF
ncbi:hypothetical protein L1987_83316 [Smallanthus sonchifolius]|uniref:Uncharacterized protein n=1 Tax=Smallanthus sonchifolius TaxID=185202 RepID=A0ACB8YD11_9ASTR|nr:hypothetical protein L1987_83316 [Smallanthus sonchifolius]